MGRRNLQNLLLMGFVYSLLTVGAPAFAANGNWLYVSRTIDPDSIATAPQLKELFDDVHEEIKADRSNTESLTILNRKLRKLGLPIIQLESPNLEVKMTKLIGFASADTIGVEILDGSHRFCLPCSIGHNDFKLGIFDYRPSRRNINGAYHPVLSCFEAIQSHYLGGLSGVVNSKNVPQVRFLSAAIDDGKRQGALVVTDQSASFFHFPFPNKTYELMWVQIPDGPVVGLRWDSNKYSDEIPAVRERSEAKPTAENQTGALKPAPQTQSEIEAMILSTLRQQMGRLLGPGARGYQPPSLAWRCAAVRACTETKPIQLTDPQLNNELRTLQHGWIEQPAACR